MATNNPIQDVLDKARKVHEPYAKKNPNRETTQKKEKEDKFEPIKATTQYGSYENYMGKDLINISPNQKTLKNALLEVAQPAKNEVLYVFDKNGNTLAKWGGEHGSVVGDDIENYKYSATLHNHPRQLGTVNTPISDGDLVSYFDDDKNINHYVVTEKYVFKFNIGKADKRNSESIVTSYRNEIKKIKDDFFMPTIKQAKSYRDVIDATEKSNNLTHEALGKLASKYGFRYFRYPIEDFKKRNNIV